MEPQPQNGVFATTHWSVVSSAGSGASPEALEQLCKTYWYPLYAYVRRKGYSVEDAQDLTQQFFARILDRNLFAKADRSRGRFRSFLLGSMEHFLANQWDRAHARKRGGDAQIIPIQIENAETRYGIEPVDNVTPEQIFEYNWAVALLDQVLERLRAEYAEPGKWNALRPFLVGATGATAYDALATSLGINEGAARVAVHRLRSRYRELLRGEIARTVSSESEVDGEMHHLFKVLAAK